jgi:hypothetical protein
MSPKGQKQTAMIVQSFFDWWGDSDLKTAAMNAAE